MSYSVTVLPPAEDDFHRLFDPLFERELGRDGGDLDYPEQAVAAIRASFSLLKKFPFTCRKAAHSSFLRELVIPFGHTGYVALFEIAGNNQVLISAVRHQREDDYY